MIALLTNALQFLLLPHCPVVMRILSEFLSDFLHLSRQGDVPEVNRSWSVVALWKSLCCATCTTRKRELQSTNIHKHERHEERRNLQESAITNDPGVAMGT